MTILIYPNETLSQVSSPIPSDEFGTDALLKLISDMKETMLAAGGIGLAAPQVGVLKRVIIVMMPGGAVEMVNPELVYQSNHKTPLCEGCLSFPGESVEVKRPEVISVRYYTAQGHLRSQVCNGIASKCIQHEIDHLNGKLIKENI